jgi:hypothetical protein
MRTTSRINRREIARAFRREFDFTQARRIVAMLVRDQLHQQHAVEESARLRHAHAGSGQTVEASTSVFFHSVSCSRRPNFVDFADGMRGGCHETCAPS